MELLSLGSSYQQEVVVVGRMANMKVGRRAIS